MMGLGIILGCGVVIAQDQNQVIFQSLNLPATTVAASTTNTTAGTAFQLPTGKSPCRIYLTASGIGASTNGSLIVKLSTATGSGYGGTGVTNAFDTAAQSNIKLTMSTLGNTTNTVSDWFQISGVKYIRVGSIENTFVGAVSNLDVTISYYK